MSLTIGQNICQSLFSPSFCGEYSEATLCIAGSLFVGAGAFCLKLIQSTWSSPPKPLSPDQVSENSKQQRSTPLEKFFHLLDENGFELTEKNQLDWNQHFRDKNGEAKNYRMAWGKSSSGRYFFTFLVDQRKEGTEFVRTTVVTVYQKNADKLSNLRASTDAAPFFGTHDLYVSGYINPELKIQETFNKFIRGEVCEQYLPSLEKVDEHFVRMSTTMEKRLFWLHKGQHTKSAARSS